MEAPIITPSEEEFEEELLGDEEEHIEEYDHDE